MPISKEVEVAKRVAELMKRFGRLRFAAFFRNENRPNLKEDFDT